MTQKDAFADQPRDLPNARPMNVAENDFVVKHRDDDPYGFWWVGREKGQVPEELSGAYTSIEAAQEAVTVHLGR